MKDLTKEEMITLLNKAEDGVLAMSDESNPYCIPIGYVCVNDKVFFQSFQKEENGIVSKKTGKSALMYTPGMMSIPSGHQLSLTEKWFQ